MDPQNLEKINDMLEQDTELRERIKEQVNEFDKKTRTLTGTLNRIHSTPTDQLPALLDSVQPVLLSCREVTSGLADIVPANQFWRWKESWVNSLRNAVFAAILVEFLRSATLLTIPEVSDLLGIQDDWKDRFVLTAEDYLHGVISVVNELSRLAVNSVTMGDYEQPLKISNFVKDIFAGFSLLNLKNDSLRRRYDSLKYDIKKIEEVVYDISLRKLASTSSKRD